MLEPIWLTTRRLRFMLNKLDLIAPLALIAFIGGLALFSMPTHDKLTQRQMLLAGITAGRDAVVAVKAYRNQHGRWPESFEQIGVDPAAAVGPNVERMMLGEQGTVRVLLAGDPALEGKSVVFDFIDRGLTWAWRCRAEGIAPEALPDMCRPDSD